MCWLVTKLNTAVGGQWEAGRVTCLQLLVLGKGNSPGTESTIAAWRIACTRRVRRPYR